MATGIRTGDPGGFNKGRSLKFSEGYRVRQTSEEGPRTYRPKRCGNDNKDEDNSPKTLNDIYIYIYIIDTVTRVQIMDEAVCTSHRANALEKIMYLTILPPAMGKQQGKLDYTTLVWWPVEKESLYFWPVKLR